MFCGDCGTEGPVYEGLCAKCFRKRYPVVQSIELLDVARCESCGSYRLRSGWSKVDRELALPQLLREAMPPLAPYERVGFTQVTRDEDANNLALTVKAVGRFQDLAVVQDFHVRVRIKPSLCDSCQKQRGRYYEGILQVRGEDRELTPWEVDAVRTFVTARVDRSEGAATFVSRVEEVHGGLDFYVSTNALAKGLAREIAGSFGGTVSASPKLFGQKQGKEVYRVTALVRLAAFQKGDVVRHKGSLAEVTSIRPFIVLRDLVTGARRGGQRQDELLSPTRTKRRPGGTQGDLHRHGGRVARTLATDLRGRLRGRREEHPLLRAVQLRGTGELDREGREASEQQVGGRPHRD